jgi:hypothetical protein
LPGPGNYAYNTSAFSDTKGAANMGSKFKPDVNDNPGPGQYTAEAKTKGSVRIGSAKRKELWDEKAQG